MTRDEIFIAGLERYLEALDVPAGLPRNVRSAVHAGVRTTRQRHPLWRRIGTANRARLVALTPPAAVAAAIAVAVIGLALGRPDGPGAVSSGSPAPSSAGASPAASAPTALWPLGVFEPARGRIVVRVGSHLEAIDPDDPASAVTIEPGDLGLGTNAMPAGWSADGTRLAITDEDRSQRYVMDTRGILSRVRTEDIPGSGSGCCWFVPSPWLSPDGLRTYTLAMPANDGEPYSLVVFDIAAPSRSQRFDLGDSGIAPGFSVPQMPAWSPDGSELAYFWHRGDLEAVEVAILDLRTGVTRNLPGTWGPLRHLTWSPDGSRLLVVASREPFRDGRLGNPLRSPIQSTLVAVDVDDGERREIATGYFIAAAWSPDGTRIAAIDFGRGRFVVVLEVGGTGVPRNLMELSGLPASETYLFSGVTWHPVP